MYTVIMTPKALLNLTDQHKAMLQQFEPYKIEATDYAYMNQAFSGWTAEECDDTVWIIKP